MTAQKQSDEGEAIASENDMMKEGEVYTLPLETTVPGAVQDREMELHDLVEFDCKPSLAPDGANQPGSDAVVDLKHNDGYSPRPVERQPATDAQKFNSGGTEQTVARKRESVEDLPPMQLGTVDPLDADAEELPTSSRAVGSSAVPSATFSRNVRESASIKSPRAAGLIVDVHVPRKLSGVHRAAEHGLWPDSSSGHRRGGSPEGSSRHTNEEPLTPSSRLLEETQFQLLQAQKQQYTSAVLRDGSVLDQTLEEWKRNRQRNTRIFMASRPLVSALKKWWFQLVFVCLCVLQTYRVAKAGYNLSARSAVSARRFRFSSLENRAGLGRTRPHLAEFGLLWDGCPVRSNSTAVADATDLVLEYASEVEMSGFYLVTAAGDAGRDPAMFRVEGWTREEDQDGEGEGEGRWEIVGDPLFRYGRNGKIWFDSDWEAGDRVVSLPTARNEYVGFDLSYGAAWLLGWFLSDAASAVGTLGVVLVAKFGRELYAFRIFRVTFCVTTGLRFSAFVVDAARGGGTEAAWWALMAAGDVLVVLVIELPGRFFLLAIVFVGLYHCLVQIVVSRLLFKALHPVPIFGAMTLLMGVLFLTLRQRLRRRAQQRVEVDRLEYHMAWMNTTVESEPLSALKTLIDSVPPIPSKAARQYNPKQPAQTVEVRRSHRRLSSSSRDRDERPARPRRLSLDATAKAVGSKAIQLARQMSKQLLAKRSSSVASAAGRELSYRSPVTSLGQLYCQARGADVLLRGKVEQWGVQANGWTKLKFERDTPRDAAGAPEYVRWREVAGDARLSSLVLWASIKSADRAVQKLLRSYKGRVSRLLDVCRQRLLFETVKDLTICMKRIIDDDNVVICRIRNYLDRQHPERLSGGFRAVIVNLRLCSPEAVASGLDTHVCELQLVTLPFAKLLSAERHVRYIKFRNDLPDRFQPFLVPFGFGRFLLGSSPQANAEKPGKSLLNVGVLLLGGTTRNMLAPLDHPSWMSEQTSAASSPAPTRLLDPSTVCESEREQALFRDFFRECCHTEAGSLQKRLAVVNSAVAHASTFSVAFTSKAASAVLSKRRWQALLWVVATVYLWRSVQTGLELNKQSFAGREFRFESLDNRRGDGHSPPHLTEFGLLWNGCPVRRMDDAVFARDNRGLVAVFDEEVEMNGFYFVTAQDAPELDPVRFVLEGRHDADDKWKTVGASGWRIQSSAFIRFLTDWKFNTPEARGAWVSRYPRARWPWVMENTVVQIVTIIFFYALVLIGALGRAKRANQILSAAFGSIGMLQVVGAVGFLVIGEGPDFAYWLLFSLANISMSALMAWYEKYFVVGMACCGVYLILLDAVFNAVALKAVSNIVLSPPLTGIGFFLFGMIVILARMRLLAKSTTLIGSDKRQYDQRWETIVNEEGVQAQVKQLARLIKRIQPKSEVLARQYLHVEKVHITPQGSSWHLAGMLPGVASSSAPNGNHHLPSSSKVAPLPCPDPSEASLTSQPAHQPQAHPTDAAPTAMPDDEGVQDEVVAFAGDVVPAAAEEGPADGVQSRDDLAGASSDLDLAPLPQRRAISTLSAFQGSSQSVASNTSAGAGAAALADNQDAPEGASDVDSEHEAGTEAPERKSGLASLRMRMGSITGVGVSSQKLGKTQSEHVGPATDAGGVKSRWTGVRGSIALRIFRSFSRTSDDDEEGDKAGNAMVHAPLTNLDQLYTQAKGVDLLLKTKVQEWALVSDGLFPVAMTDAGRIGSGEAKPRPTFVKWSEAVQEASKERSIKWGKIKTVDRAIEKLLRSYKADVSRLLDVCRQSIVFDSILDLSRCLEVIRQDPDITIVRVKNRMDPEYDSSISAGYRDVVLNVRVTSPRAIHLRIDTHVCEVQLILGAFAEMKHDQGHKRYKQFRDTRGE